MNQFCERRDVISHQVRPLAQRMADKHEENKSPKLSNVGTTKRKEILVSKTKQEIFQATKLLIETTSSKLLGLEVDQTVKPNQTSLALCLRFLSPWHHQEMFTKGRFYTEKF